MWKLVIYTFLLSNLCAYIIITRQYFVHILDYIHNATFCLMYGLMVAFTWVYMLLAAVIYNIFLVYRPWWFRKWRKSTSTVTYFLMSFLVISLLHGGQLELLFEMKNHTLLSSGYLHNDVFFFLAILSGYLWLVYKRPGLSIMNWLIWNLFKGGLIWAEQNMGKKPEKTADDSSVMTVLSEENPVEEYPPEQVQRLTEKRVRVFDILLFHFSKKEGSYFIDKQGNRTYCRCTSSILNSWKVSPWFVKVNNKVFLNMWYFSKSQRITGAVLLDEPILSKIAQRLHECGIDLRRLIKVSERCKRHVKEHFVRREHLGSEGWEAYFYYD